MGHAGYYLEHILKLMLGIYLNLEFCLF